MTPADEWLAAMWPVVRERLPAPPARVVEVGCGPLGGFVPALRDDGYDAVGVDPKAPSGPHYRQVEIEELTFEQIGAVVASTSLHHVADPRQVIAALANALKPAGTVIVIEWAWEDFDQATARWAFERLGPEDEDGWLQRRREQWIASGLAWDEFLRGWADEHGIHSSSMLLQMLDEHFERKHLSRGPYLFADLGHTTQEEELEAIAAGEIRATRVDYVGHARR